MEFKGGFIALKFAKIIWNDTALQKILYQDIFKLILEMAPVYWKFGLTPCDTVMNSVDIERLLSNYSTF